MTELSKDKLTTPALIFDERTLLERSRRLSRVSSRAGAQLLFALKSIAYVGVLDILKSFVDGLACSSLFEAKLAREVGNRHRSVHITSPGLRQDEIDEIAATCDYISFNSLTQWRRHRSAVSDKLSCGLRVNPQLPFVADDRYNPCRAHSKLGVGLSDLVTTLSRYPNSIDGIRGIHIHNNCDSTDLSQLSATVECLTSPLAKFLKGLEWINIGGGYLFNDDEDITPFLEVVENLRLTYGLRVFIEPGAAFVREAGSLVSSVVDLFESEGKKIAVLDTTINHMPEVFEYQCPPDLADAKISGKYQYLLVGGTCLAGDLFGEFAFAEPLEVGSKITFANAGAYTFVKAHTFNGINLPTVYSRKLNGELVMQTEFTYNDFARRNGVEGHVLI